MVRQLVAATLLVGCPFVQASTPLEIYSVEPNTCGAWHLSAANPKVRQAQYFWFLGFVSGNNFALSNQQVPANRILKEVEFEKLVTAKCNQSNKYTLAIIAMEFVEQNSPPAKNAAPKK
jgi:hypothetical protein